MDRVILASGLALAVGACATLPTPRYAGIGDRGDVAASLVNRVVCEIAATEALPLLQGTAKVVAAPAERGSYFSGSDKRIVPKSAPAPVAPPPVTPPPADAKPPPPDFDIFVELTLKAEASGGLKPTLNFIHPFATEGTSRTGILGIEFTRAGSRSEVENFAVNSRRIPLKDDDSPQAAKFRTWCEEINAKVQGEFGVTALIDRAMLRKLEEPVAADTSAEKGFGTTIEFSLKQGIAAGPHWVRTRFTGPSGDGLVNGSRTDTNTLVIAIAKHDPEADGNAAAPLAQRMILQNLRLLPLR